MAFTQEEIQAEKDRLSPQIGSVWGTFEAWEAMIKSSPVEVTSAIVEAINSPVLGIAAVAHLAKDALES